ncbi:MAG: L-alanine-DL-glutamate epimerase [Chloroflexi bacterium]|jgi:L-alanine-DL-glutamate epimerase-like enolase superfamily enzyme|nr:MAG: L-alanine-DL-glutamate epimerase [Chloroflexota bacterium]
MGGGRGLSHIPHILVRLHTDNGIEGLGYILILQPRSIAPVKSAIEQLGPVVVGMDPLTQEAVNAAMHKAIAWIGPFGAASAAHMAIDMAMWDIAGKAAGQPLWKLLGGFRPRVPVCASHRLRPGATLPELQQDASDLMNEGFRAVKMSLEGKGHPRLEAERVRVVREVVGEDVEIMVDIHQGWQPSQAIRAGRLFEQYHLSWIEDPIHHRNADRLAEVARALDTPVMAGQYCHGSESLLALLRANAVDILMIDLMRVGGVTQWRKAAAMAEAFDVPVASHLMPEANIHLMAAAPNGVMTDYRPWSSPLFKRAPVIEDGEMVAPDGPGLGLELDEEAVSRFVDRNL